MQACRIALFAFIAAIAAPVPASFHTFRIEQVFSNADGSVQYVVLREAASTNGEHLWIGQTLRTTNAAGESKQFSFPGNLASSSTSGRRVLVATQGFAALNLVTPDYTIPDRFIPTDGGTLDFASNTDRITLPALPNDGVTAIDRNGATVAASPRNFANATATMTAQPVTSVEFFNAALDHYFISALAPDIDALDSGRLPGWQRTGGSFRVFPSQAAGGASTVPVCRIIIPPPHGDSHFFGRSAQECGDTLAKFPFMSQETPSAFFVTLPDGVGACPASTVPVYRVFSNRADANHRYTTSRDVRSQMAAAGWTIEGDGPDFVVMCAAGGSAAAADPPPQPPPGAPPPPPCGPYGCAPGGPTGG